MNTTAIVITRCVPGCPSRVGWAFYPGVSGSWDGPGGPDELVPEVGCSEDHLDLVNDDLTLADDAWLQLWNWDRHRETAVVLAAQSRAYLRGHTAPAGGLIRVY